MSLDAIKKEKDFKNLTSFFQKVFQKNYEEAQKNFVESLDGYCLLSYIL